MRHHQTLALCTALQQSRLAAAYCYQGLTNLPSVLFQVFFLLVFALLCLPLYSPSALATEIELSPAEHAFIEETNTIDIAVMYDFVPFSYVEDGVYKGFVADLMKLLEKKTGATLKPRIGEWSDNLSKLNNKRIDAIADISFKPERTSFVLYTSPYFEIPIAVFTDKSFGRYKGLADLSGKHVGLLKGIFYQSELLQLEDIRISTYEGYEQLTRAVALGEVDVGLQNLTSGLYYASQNAYTNVHVAGEFTVKNLGREDLRFGVQVDKPEVQSILQKGLDSITPREWKQLTDHWLGVAPSDILSSHTSLSLTSEEREFVKNNPVIRVQNETNYQPYNFFEDNMPRGHSVELMRLLAKKVGFEVDFISGYSWQDYLQMIRGDELDVMVNIAYSEQRETYLKFTSPYLRQAQGIYYRQGSDPVNTLEQLRAARIALPEGFYIYDVLKADGRFTVLPTRDSLEALLMVSTGQADATIESMTVAEHLAHKYAVPGIAVTSPPQMEPTDPLSLRLAVSQNNPMLHRLLQKAIDSLTEQEARQLQYKWTANPSESQHYLHLTAQELAWMESRAAVRICTVKQALPYEGLNEQGLHQGAFADLLDIMRKNSGLNIRLVGVSHYREAMQKLRRGHCDLITQSVSEQTPGDIRYSQPLLEMPLVVATQLNAVYVDSFDKLKAEKVAVIADSHIHAFLQQEHPALALKAYPNMHDALGAVSSGEVFGVVDTLPTISRIIATEHRTDLKISGELMNQYPMRLATHRDNATLLQIINKAIQSITPDQYEQAESHWLQTPVLTEPADYRLIKQVGALVAVVLVLIIIWNRKLSKLNRQVNESRNQLLEMHEQLQAKNRLLEQLSTTDQLTGLKNRHFLEAEVPRQIAQVEHQPGAELTLLLFDIDHFKQVNDQYGHHIGDTVLAEFAELLSQNIRELDIAARWGGEEFLLLCPDTGLKDAHQYAWTLLSKIRQFEFDQVGHCTASIGIASWKAGDNFDSICQRADSALYDAKAMGRNRVCIESVEPEEALVD